MAVEDGDHRRGPLGKIWSKKRVGAGEYVAASGRPSLLMQRNGIHSCSVAEAGSFIAERPWL
jgi:hypothetical protein